MTTKTLRQVNNEQGFTLIELLVVIGILAILMGIVIIAINPSRQFKQANDTTRRNGVTQILNAISQYSADNKGALPAPLVAGYAATGVKTGGADICAAVMPTYIASLPEDPGVAGGAAITSCASYDSGYTVSVDATGRVTVTAPNAEIAPSISATR